jgi:hypothetical protein
VRWLVLLPVLACAARETAKDAYTLQSNACLVAYTDRAHQVACLDDVRARWTEAGAPPAAALDGGSHD